MKFKVITGLMLTLFLASMLTLAINIQQVKSDWTWTETIYIRADGSVDPDTAPISSSDNITYTLTDNIIGDVPEDISAIVVERDNIVVDGTGYSLQGTASGMGIELLGRSNVTIKNMEIKAFAYGIFLSGASNNIIQDNNVTANTIYGIRFRNYSNNNTISENNVTNNYIGIWLYESSENSVYRNDVTNNTYGIRICFCAPNNRVYHNIFIQNKYQAYGYNSTGNVWDNGYPSGGNYWSDHVCTGNPSDGSQPYVIDANNTDHYPFQDPDGWLLPPPTPVGGIYIPVNKLELLAPYIELTILLAVAVTIVGYVKKRKRNREINS